MNQRYFIGITLPEDLSRKIEQLQHHFFQPGKVMYPLKPHITLLHPDLLQTLAPIYFVPKIKEIANSHLPFKINLTKTNMFDKRVLYIDVSSEDLISFQKILIDILPEDIKSRYLPSRSYKPHITLVQAKPKKDLSARAISSFKTQVDPMLPRSFSVDHLAQFTWLRPKIYDIKRI